MSLLLDCLSWLLILTGGTFCLLGGIGLLRMPDFYTRTHAASLPDTLGVMGIIGGLILQGVNGGHWMSVIKLSLIIVFILFTGPIATHALTRTALSHGHAPVLHENRLPEQQPVKKDSKAGRKRGRKQ
ncbi:monovalent cation/H(+) antiporter subunit G [Insolitispirillum peregrinum]|uniref:monovalent cation/H(+) antiporter subunit G n=1 Tax=Insolitispirillum peregrinum TaxID=80876 RepID=UPI00361AE6B4